MNILNVIVWCLIFNVILAGANRAGITSRGRNKIGPAIPIAL